MEHRFLLTVRRRTGCPSSKLITMDKGTCGLCDLPSNVFMRSGHRQLTIECGRCGKYITSMEFAADFAYERKKTPGAAAALSAATRQASDAGGTLTLQNNDWRRIAREHTDTPLATKTDMLLAWSAKISNHYGKTFAMNPLLDYPVCDAVNQDEIVYIFRHLIAAGYIEGRQNNENVITFTGWERLNASPPIGGEPGRCFVAMSFDPSMDGTYVNAIEPAAKDSGFTAYIVKKDTFNDDITDKILSEIRRAQFVIADCTGQRNGVYYEAGFARGLGRQVIMTCREDDFRNAHFDTNHLNYVVWKDEADLRQKLADRIRATIVPPR